MLVGRVRRSRLGAVKEVRVAADLHEKMSAKDYMKNEVLTFSQLHHNVH